MINDVIQLLGIANPQLSLQWTLAAGTVLTYDNAFRLNSNGDRFVAPVAGFLNVNRGMDKIVMPGGGPPPTVGVVIKMDPQIYLRITRMYATEIEGVAAGGNTSVTERPVPCYFVYTNITGQQWNDPDDNNNAKTGPNEGLVLAGNDLHLSGDLTIHDQFGFPIDPLAVAAAFDAFVVKFDTLESKQLNAATTSPNAHQIAAIAGIGATPNTTTTTIQLVTPNGMPFTTGMATFQNLADPNSKSTEGFYTIPDLTKPIIKQQPASDTKIGAATNGTLTDTYPYKARNPAVAVFPRDFLRAYVVPLNTYLLGTMPVPNNEPSYVHSVPPVVRDNEPITLLINGNECLAAVNSITAAAQPLTLLASQVVDNDFVLPPVPGGMAGSERWPQFPVPVGGNNGSTTPVLATLKANFVLAAYFIADQPTNNSDVFVSLSTQQQGPQLTSGDAIRIYPRVFHDDGTETRGDGAGAIVQVVNNKNIAVFRLKDPFGLVNGIGQVSALTNPTLMLDVVLVNRGMIKRTFGNIHCPVTTPAQGLALADSNALGNLGNNFNAVPERGISPAGISGTSSAIAPIGNVNFGNFLLSLIGEGQPRTAPRYPTMARNDSMAASFNANPGANNWQAFCGGTIFRKDALSNFPLMGNPGSPGGREYSSVGVYTMGGVLAYDIARAAYRRTRNVIQRMLAFATGATANSWNVPPPMPAGANNTWAAAALQNIADHCETPEIGLEFNDLAQVPNTFAQFVANIKQALGLNVLPAWVPAAAKTGFNNILNNFQADPQNQRAYGEMRREFASSIYGRRDSYWALKEALTNAKECIYIQGTFFGHTAYGNPADGPDFIALLKTLIANNPRLKIILCLGKQIHYGKGYETFEAREYKKRLEAVADLRGDNNPDPVTLLPARANQVLAFHPNGFPMRPKLLQHHVVIVDDMWALVGSSTFRRRGLQFDGSEDIVMIDKKISNGKSAGIKAFRIRLMQEHLNLQNNAPGLTPGLQVQLNDLHESFYAIKELLDSGGAGVISPIWEGDRKDDINEASFPLDDLADPSSNTFNDQNAVYATLSAALAGLSTTPA